MSQREIISDMLSKSTSALDYLVEISRRPGAKSGYKTKYILASEDRAWFYYRGINIGRGYKKRLVAVSEYWGVRRVLARTAS